MTTLCGYATVALAQTDPISDEVADEPSLEVEGSAGDEGEAERGPDAPAEESASDTRTDDPVEERTNPSPVESPDEAPADPKGQAAEQPPPAETPAVGEGESAEEGETAAEEGETAAPDDPYAGLDHTGTPPPPPREGHPPPEGEWHEDYDGRPNPIRAEDVVIWIPRTPLLPLYAVLNYGARLPIVHAITKAEEVRLFHRIEDLLTFADRRAAILPIAYYSDGRGFWGGFHFFFNDWGVEGHRFQAQAGVGTKGAVLVRAEDSWDVFEDDAGRVSFGAAYERDPSLAFTGLGSGTDVDDETFFTSQKIEAQTKLEVSLGGLSSFSVGFDYHHGRLLAEGREPALEDGPLAPLEDDLTGFDDWFDLIALRMSVTLDTRDPDREFSSGSGFRWSTWGSSHVGIDDPQMVFFKYGTRPGVLLDLSGVNHVLSLSVHAEALSKVHGEDPPLTEYVSLGGPHLMRGFRAGRFRGESALVYSLAYSWPALAFADALLFTDFGSTFSGIYDDFDHDQMSLDWGFGFRTSFSREWMAQAMVAWGTNRAELWDEQFEIERTRVVVGIGHGF